MKHSLTLTIALAALLSGCKQGASSSATKADVNALSARLTVSEITVGRLEADNAKLRSDVNELRGFVLLVNKSLDKTQDVVTNNARAMNDNTLADMTLRGACGTEYVPAGNGGYVLANKKCTKADLKK